MADVHNLKQHKKQRKHLRNNATESERLLWLELKNSKLGYKFRRQHSIGNYIIDFYCPKLMLAIELDGQIHEYREKAEKDIKRDNALRGLNIKTLRFENYEVTHKLDRVIRKIKQEIQSIF